MKKTMTIEDRAQDLANVLVFKIAKNIKDNFQTVGNFKKHFAKIQQRKASHDDIVKFCKMFSLEKQHERAICGGNHVREVRKMLPSWLHWQGNFTIRYKSGKTFAVHAYYYIDWRKLDEMFAWPNEECVFDIRSSYFTDRQRKLAFKTFFKKVQNQEKVQKTKKDKEEVNICKIEETKKEEEDMKRRHAGMKIQTPENDVDFDEPNKKQVASNGLTKEQEKFACKMQDWVSQKALGIFVARKMLKDIGKSAFGMVLEEPRGGVSAQEIDMVRQAKIENMFVTLFASMLGCDEYKYWYNIAMQNVKWLAQNGKVGC